MTRAFSAGARLIPESWAGCLGLALSAAPLALFRSAASRLLRQRQGNGRDQRPVGPIILSLHFSIVGLYDTPGAV